MSKEKKSEEDIALEFFAYVLVYAVFGFLYRYFFAESAEFIFGVQIPFWYAYFVGLACHKWIGEVWLVTIALEAAKCTHPLIKG